MRSSPLRSCRKALCTLLGWGTLTLVILLGSSVVFVLLLPVARDMAWSLKASYRGEIRTVCTESAGMPPLLPPSIPATPWHPLGMEPLHTDDDGSRDVDVTRVR